MSAHHPECPRADGDAFPCICATFMPAEPPVTEAGRAERVADLTAKLSGPLDAMAQKLEALIQKAAAGERSEHLRMRKPIVRPIVVATGARVLAQLDETGHSKDGSCPKCAGLCVFPLPALTAARERSEHLSPLAPAELGPGRTRNPTSEAKPEGRADGQHGMNNQ